MRTGRERVGGFAIPLALFVAIGVTLWGWNAWRLLRGRAAPAVVLSSAVGSSRGRNGTSYHPLVGYRYTVDGTQYSGTKVFAGAGEGRGRDWAAGVAARFKAGDSTTAYVSPSDPSDAYLVRQPSAGPLFVIAFPLAIVGLLLVGGNAHEDDPMPPPDPSPDGAGRWTLTPSTAFAEVAAGLRPAARRWQLATIAVLGAHAALAVVCAGRAGSFSGTVGTLWRATLGDGFFVFALVALGGMGYVMARQVRGAAERAARVRGARLAVDAGVVRVGETTGASLQLTLARTTLHRGSIKLECSTNDARTNKRLHHEVVAPLGEAPGAVAAIGAEVPTATFAIPATSPASTVVADAATLTRWAFVATLELADGRDAELRFPVRVHAPS